jgi:glycosyltransferase involved in cell wall biosynthesis
MLARAVDSVLRQGCPDFELIIVDDGSTATHAAVLSTFEDPRVRVLRNPETLGVAAARNKGIEAARGRYISFLDDDDEYLESFLKATYDTLRDTPPEVALCWSSARCVEDSVLPGAVPRVTEILFATEYATLEGLFQAFLSIGTGFGVTLKAAALGDVGAFDTRLRTIEDTDLFYRLLERGFVPTVLPGIHIVLHDHHEPRLTHRDRHATRIRECEWLVSEHAAFMDRYPSLRRDLLRGVASLRALVEVNGR